MKKVYIDSVNFIFGIEFESYSKKLQVTIT